MKRIFASILFTLVACFAMLFPSAANGDVGKSFLYDPATKVLSPAITSDAGKLTNLFGKKGFDLGLVSFASSTTSGVPSFGYAALANYSLSREITLKFGPALLARQSEKPVMQIMFGATYKF